MGFQDRRYDQDGSGDGMVRRLASGFFSWSLPLFTVPRWVPGVRGIHVRLHITYILLVLGQLASLGARDAFPFLHVASMLVTLFVMVLLHEFGHCVACRAVGGSADEVLMWPLGGLAYCAPPQRWRAALVTTIGGPAVNLALLPLLGGLLIATFAPWGLLIYNPLKVGGVVTSAYFYSAWHVWLWSAYSMNVMLLFFNLLVPMYPMDGAKIVQELLWGRIGHRRSMQIATTVGLVTAVMLAIVGLVFWNWWLISIALFGGWTCYSQRQQLAVMEPEESWFDTEKGYRAFESEERARPSRAERRAEKTAVKERERAQEAEAVVDKILDKIRAQGIASLTAREKALLKDATERTRGRG
jgi:Zn-dependent protease